MLFFIASTSLRELESAFRNWILQMKKISKSSLGLGLGQPQTVSDGLKRPQTASNDLKRPRMDSNGLKKASNDLKQPRMDSNGLEWPKKASNHLK